MFQDRKCAVQETGNQLRWGAMVWTLETSPLSLSSSVSNLPIALLSGVFYLTGQLEPWLSICVAKQEPKTTCPKRHCFDRLPTGLSAHVPESIAFNSCIQSHPYIYPRRHCSRWLPTGLSTLYRSLHLETQVWICSVLHSSQVLPSPSILGSTGTTSWKSMKKNAH